MNETKPKRKRRWLVILIAVLVLLGGLAAIAFFVVIPSVAVGMVEDAIAEYGAQCDELSVSTSLSGTAEIDATTCAFDDGPIASLTTTGAMNVTLDGFDPRSVRTGRIDIDLRPTDWQTVPVDGLLREIAQVQPFVEELLIDGAALATYDFPAIHSTTLMVSRSGEPVVRIENANITKSQGGYQLTADWAEFLTVEAPPLEGVTMSLNADEAVIEGEATGRRRILLIEVEKTVDVRIEGHGLSAVPTFDYDIDFI